MSGAGRQDVGAHADLPDSDPQGAAGSGADPRPATGSQDRRRPGLASSRRIVRRLWPLVFLAPDIQQAILEGRQPPALTLDQLLRMRLPTDWAEQRRTLCFDE